MHRPSTLFPFGNLGFILCENFECATSIRALPEDCLSWNIPLPNTGYSLRAESVNDVTVIYQPSTWEAEVMERHRLQLKLPTEAVIISDKEDTTRFNYKGLEFAIIHSLVLPPNYQEKIRIPV
jgi:hypothetical protein